ncbi:MAG: acyl-CoA dehydrogenase family protein [Burkholderiaceae bacterium]|nr:acyl-CoA dehydrogenase family protein [Burkholderiaceae bacterium]
MPAIAYQYSEDIQAVVEGLERFLRKEVIPRHDDNPQLYEDERDTFTPQGIYRPEVLAHMREVRTAASSAGYYNMCAPESIGGQGLGHLAWFAAWERAFRICHDKYWLCQFAISHWAFGPSVVLEKMTDKAKAELLPAIVSGEKMMSFGMSEPGAGSDATMMKTRAVPDGDGWRITGGKIWTTGSPYADYCLIFAITDAELAAGRKGGISAFLVPTNSPGFKVERVIKMWGSVGGNEALLYFDNMRVEAHQLVGTLNRGFNIAMLGVNLGKLFNAARAVGMSRWALEIAFDYVKIRKAFGHTLSEYQGVTFPLAESSTDIHAAHLMSINAAHLLDQGIDARKELSMTKGFAVKAGARAIDRVMQAHGAIGMTNEMWFTQAYRTLRNVQIADGANEVLNRTIVKEMLGGDLEL